MKLVRLSASTIKKFGIVYFLNAASIQLKRNKLSVLLSEPESVHKEKYSHTRSYKIWLREHEINSEKESEMKNQLSRFTKRPIIGLFLTIEDKNKQFFKDTLSSIIQQPYENLRIHPLYFTSEYGDIEDILKKVDDKRIIISKNKTTYNLKISDIDEEYIIFLKCGDVLTKNALFEIMRFIDESDRDYDIVYSDEDHIDKEKRIDPFFKPDWSPELFLSFDYVSRFYMVSKKIFLEIGGFNEKFHEANHYDLLLRLTETAKKIVHIPTVLVSCRKSNYVFTESYLKEAQIALSEALRRREIYGVVIKGSTDGIFRIKYDLQNEPSVAIIIPTKDNVGLLRRCINSIKNKTSYKNYQIVIIDNNSVKTETLSYLSSLPHKIIKYESSFNFSKLNNLAASKINADYLLFLNDDTAVIEPEWLTELVSTCQQKEIGIVGPKLVYSNNLIQHAGITLLDTGAGFHPLQGINADSLEYHGFVNVARNYSSVTGACLLIKKKIFEDIGHFDDQFDLYYGDVDLCFKTIEKGYRVVYTPHAKLLHEGSSKIKEQSSVFYTVENHYDFMRKWPQIKNGDPYYNPNLTWDFKIDNGE